MFMKWFKINIPHQGTVGVVIECYKEKQTVSIPSDTGVNMLVSKYKFILFFCLTFNTSSCKISQKIIFFLKVLIEVNLM